MRFDRVRLRLCQVLKETIQAFDAWSALGKYGSSALPRSSFPPIKIVTKQTPAEKNSLEWIRCPVSLILCLRLDVGQHPVQFLSRYKPSVSNDRVYFSRVGDIRERVRVDQDEVGQLSLLDRPQIFFAMHEEGGIDRRRLEGLERRHARENE